MKRLYNHFMVIEEGRIQGSKLSKVGLLFRLYNIHPSYLCDVFNRERLLTYSDIINGKAKRIEKEPLAELCNFLNVSSATVLDAIAPQRRCEVYISDKDVWIEFGLYIYLRSTGIVIDQFNEEKNSVIHVINFYKVSELNYNKEGTSYLIKRAKKNKLINSSKLRLINNRIAPKTKELLLKEIYVYISKYLTPEEFEENTKEGSYKDLVISIMDYMNFIQSKTSNKKENE